MKIFELLFLLIISHLFGDYVLQVDYIAKTKVNNLYHLFVHCILYLLPFYFVLGFHSHLIVILISHFIIDLGKCKGKINYVLDQILHYIVLIGVLFI